MMQSCLYMSVEYNAVVLSCGAAKGFYQLGALHYLYEQNLLEGLKYFAGTSVGSAIACCLAVGFTPIECCMYLCSNDVSKLFEPIYDIRTIFNKWGLIQNEKLKTYLENMIKSKWGCVPTFAELKAKGKVFICCAYCLGASNPKEYFSYKSHPDMLVTDAVCLSSNIPIVFTKAVYKDRIYVDGGLFDRLPANFLYHFISDEWDMPEMIILDLGTDKEPSVDGFSTYIKHIFYIPLDSQKTQVFDKPGMHYFKITSDDDSPIQLNMSNKEKIQVFCNGVKLMKRLREGSDEGGEADKLKVD